MNRNAILNAMEKKAKAVFDESETYAGEDKRGMLVVEIRDAKNPGQWDSSCRNFGAVFRDYTFDGDLVINNGTNFDALVRGKVAFSRRTEKNSGTNYYQVLGYEAFWPGSVISDDGKCICAFAGLTAIDNVVIAKAGITCYESLKRTGKSLDAKSPPSDEPEYDEDDEEPEDTGEDEED